MKAAIARASTSLLLLGAACSSTSPSTPETREHAPPTNEADRSAPRVPASDEAATSDASASSGAATAVEPPTGTPEAPQVPVVEDPVEAAIARGIEAAPDLAQEDLVMLLLLDAMHRRHGVAAFEIAAERYDALLAQTPEPPVDALAFRRVFDAEQRLTAQQIGRIAPGVNEVTVPALFCDVVPLTRRYGKRLARDAAEGGYELTHVALALRWMEDLGCTPPVEAGFRDRVRQQTRALVDPSDGLGDLELEALIFGSLLDEELELPAAVVEATVAAQLEDGSWPHDPGDAEARGHTTGLALMLLLELRREPMDTFVTTAGRERGEPPTPQE